MSAFVGIATVPGRMNFSIGRESASTVSAMALLKNPKHERFAQLVVRGDLSATSAYIKCGYSKNGAEGAACKLQRIAKVGARIAELHEAGAAKLALSREEFQADLLKRFRELPPESPVTAKYGEMLARSMGWNEPDKMEMNGQQVVTVVIGGNEMR